VNAIAFGDWIPGSRKGVRPGMMHPIPPTVMP
jgi:hypothetical protein